MSTAKSPGFHVFISHSSEDRTWADAACEVLERRKMRCWIAPRNITPGTEWGAAIVNGIDRSRVMLLIFSANANQSPQVRREVERAIAKSIPILPLRIEDIRPQGAMEFALSNTHWLDAFVPPAADRFVLMADAIEALLGAKREKKSPTPGTASMPILRRSRSKRVVAALIALTVFVLIGAFVFRGRELLNTESSAKAIDTAATAVVNSKPTNTRTVAAGTSEDETLSFQGRWVAVAESTPGGVASESAVKERDYSLIIQEHSVTHRRHPTSTETVTLTGFISFQKENNIQTLTVRGTDGEGVHRTWIGLYAIRDNTLELCYRESEGRGVQPVPPVFMNDTGQRGTHYVKLVRARQRKKR